MNSTVKKEKFAKIKEVIKDYNKKFNKYGAELDELYSWNNTKPFPTVSFNMPDLKICPFNNSDKISVIKADFEEKATFDFLLPYKVSSDKEWDDVINGMEILFECKELYENMLHDIDNV